MATHFCGGKAIIKQLQLGHLDLSCGMPEADAMKSCDGERPSESQIEKIPCCSNLYQSIQTEEELKTAVQTVQAPEVVFTAPTFQNPNLAYFQFSAAGMRNYHPPPLIDDRQLRFEIFRI